MSSEYIIKITAVVENNKIKTLAIIESDCLFKNGFMLWMNSIS